MRLTSAQTTFFLSVDAGAIIQLLEHTLSCSEPTLVHQIICAVLCGTGALVTLSEGDALSGGLPESKELVFNNSRVETRQKIKAISVIRHRKQCSTAKSFSCFR